MEKLRGVWKTAGETPSLENQVHEREWWEEKGYTDRLVGSSGLLAFMSKCVWSSTCLNHKPPNTGQMKGHHKRGREERLVAVFRAGHLILPTPQSRKHCPFPTDTEMGLRFSDLSGKSHCYK